MAQSQGGASDAVAWQIVGAFVDNALEELAITPSANAMQCQRRPSGRAPGGRRRIGFDVPQDIRPGSAQRIQPGEVLDEDSAFECSDGEWSAFSDVPTAPDEEAAHEAANNLADSAVDFYLMSEAEDSLNDDSVKPD